jgi:hypothetical protein
MSKHVAQLYIRTQLSNPDSCVVTDTDLFINISFVIIKTCHILEYLLAVLIGILEDDHEGRNM